MHSLCGEFDEEQPIAFLNWCDFCYKEKAHRKRSEKRNNQKIATTTKEAEKPIANSKTLSVSTSPSRPTSKPPPK